MKEELLTLQQLAAESGFSKTTLYRICAPQGDLPVVRIAVGPGAKRQTRGPIRVRRSDWLAWLERHTTAGPAETPAAAVARRSVLDLPGASRYV